MVGLMRDIVCQYVTKGVQDKHIAQLLMGETTAQVIATAWVPTGTPTRTGRQGSRDLM
jgi:hypothetical protein